MIDSHDIQLLRQTVSIQKARRANWSTGEPADMELETTHAAQLTEIHKQLSARDQKIAGTSEAPPAAVLTRGGWAAAAGNILQNQ
jgi:hypothetical protein